MAASTNCVLKSPRRDQESTASGPVVQTRIKRLIKKCARVLGAEVVTAETAEYWARQSLSGVLRQIPKSGVRINTVIDVGAAHGA
jgi:hypothetical protein